MGWVEMVKFCVLDADIEDGVETVRRVVADRHIRWKAVVQATGLGWLRLDGSPVGLHSAMQELRTELGRVGGSLIVVPSPPGSARLDAWGNPRYALPRRRGGMQKFVPTLVLSPGRCHG